MNGRSQRHKMPTRNSKPSDSEGESSPMMEKDSDFLNKTQKVWSRELRNRFVISSGKRSLRFSNSDPTRRRSLRNCRVVSLARTTHYSLSQSDEDEDDRIFTPLPPHSHRKSRRDHGARRSTQESPPRRTRDIGMPSTSQAEDGIRRSTRVRNLRYDNYNDSWIVGAQTLRGYPSYRNAPYSDAGMTGAEKDDEDGEEEEEREEEDDEGEEEKPLKRNGNHRLRSSDTAVAPATTSKTPPPPPSTPSLRAKPLQKPQSKLIKKEPTDTTEAAATEERASEEEEEEGEEEEGEEEGEDMYARVKTRRQSERKLREESNSSSDSDSWMGGKGKQRRWRLRTRAKSRVEKPKYHLRQNKPTVDRFQAAEPDKRRSVRVLREVMNSVRKRHRRSCASSSSDSSTSDGRFDRKKGKGKSRNRMELAGSGGGAEERGGGGSALADARPLEFDSSIGFKQVGGLERVVEALKETVVFPVLYSEVFAKFGVTPPKGVLFHGPPGTGKTLVARALASECSRGQRKVSFFMRKGADCLSKWVGESERQLRILFEEAKQARPSIIFFDELDGLAPVRSTKQDQIHASIVCTLLALMDGLDSRGDIVVIGATNRIDAIDPALRRPGRFDRELHFPLPGVKERREILGIHSNGWAEPGLLNRMAEMSAGYCGSDLKALCTEAVIQALKRIYPQIYTSDQKLLLDPDRVKVERIDFERASRGIIPASQRSTGAPGRKLPTYLEPLLGKSLGSLIRYVTEVFPPAFNRNTLTSLVRSPRLLLVGQTKQTMILSLALLYKLEHCPIHSVCLENLFGESSRTPEESIVKVFKELPQCRGSILWFGDITLWWAGISDLTKAVFTSLMSLLDPALPILFLATSCTPDIPPEVQTMFSSYRGEIQSVERHTREQKEAFFRPLFRLKALRPPPSPKKKKEELIPLAVAPPPPPPRLNEEQLSALYHEEENTLRELRIFLRQICAKLARNKQFYMFSKPVDIKEVPDYLQIVKEPMDLETMMTRIDLHKYTCAQDFLNDIDLLCRNALEYNPDRDPADKLIRHRACFLRDTAYALIKAEMDSDFEVNCRMIRESRKSRGDIAEERFTREFFPVENQNPEAEEPTGAEEAVEAEPRPPASECKSSGRSLSEGSLSVVSRPAGGGVSSSAGTPTSSTEVKRRRKKSVWSKGIANRKARSRTPAAGQPSPLVEGLKDDPEAAEDSTVQKTKKIKLQDSVGEAAAVNGIGSSTSSEEAEPVASEAREAPAEDEEEEEVAAEVEVDRAELAAVHQETLDLLEPRNSLETLLDLYSALRAVVESYRRKTDRRSLPSDLRTELSRFLEEYGPEDEEEEEENLPEPL